MAIYKLPPSDDKDKNSNNQNDPSQRKLPKFIFIGDEQSSTAHQHHHRAHAEAGETSTPKQDPFLTAQSLVTKNYPWIMRALTFIISILGVMLAFGILVLCATMVIIAGGLLFQYEEANKTLISYWKSFRRTLVCSWALFIASFSPSLGFGILFLYFALQGEKMNNSFLNRIIDLGNKVFEK